MAKFAIMASELKSLKKSMEDRKLAELKKEIIEILKKQDEKDFKKAVDYFESQELHFTHLEKSLVSGKWVQKAGYGIGTVRIWKGKKYKKIAPGKWARVFDKEGRGTNIAIGKLIARVQKIDNVEDLMAFVMQNKQRFVDENGIDLPVLDKLRAAVDAKNNGDIGSKETAKPAESTTTAELINKNKDKIDKYGIDIYKDEISNTTPKALKNMDEKELKDFINFTEYLKNENEKIHDNAQNQNEKNKAWMSAAHSEQLNRMAKNRLKAVIAQNEPIKNFNTEVANSVDIENFKKELDDSYNSEFRVASRLSEGDTDYSEGAIKFDKLVKNDKGAKDFIEKISNTNVDEIDSSLYKTVVMDLLEKEGFFKESEAEKTQNRSEAMKGNKNAYKGGSKEELQNELMSLSKQKSEILDEIKKTNGDLAKINQDKYNDEARGNPTEDYDKQIEELKKKMDNLQDEHADIEKRGNDIVKELDKLEKEENKVIENNPKSIEGMEFVNKNKMHALANFLANHDNVNMATAVIRLQAAYEKLGEEKFLSYFPKDVVERYRKESGKEKTKTETPKFTPKKDFKSMSDDELKDYEAKLEKDLLNSNRNDSDYMDKYNHWREVHGENNDRFHQRIEDEARAEKQAEADAKSAKEKEIKEKYHGYFDSRSGLDKARDLKTLEKKYNFDGKVMSSKEFVEQAMDNGVEIKEREVNKLDYPSRTRWNRMNGYEQDEYEKRIKAAGKKTVYSINGFEFPKTVVDYAKFYKENGKSKTESEKPSKSEIAIKNKATSLAGAFGYSKTYATKMGSPFNLELAEQTVDEELDWDDGSKKALKEELRRIYSEKKVQKSLFDDFIMDVFEADKEEEIEDAIKADETEYNDYSAEQPELFNSTAMKVREALDRIKNQVL